MTEEGDVTQPLQWSSEYADPELGLTYYNYRYYNSQDGRWTKYDPTEESSLNRYGYIGNHPTYAVDILGRNENCSSYTDEDYAQCIDVIITIKVRRLLFLYVTKEWQPGKENAVSLTDTFYQFPHMTIRATWKDILSCKCAKKCFDISGETVSYQINYHTFNKEIKDYLTVNKLPSYTLYGPPSDLELSYAHKTGLNAIGVGLVITAIPSCTEYLHLEVKVGSYEYLSNDYYL